MEPRTLIYMAEACQGLRLSGAPDRVVRRVCTDSRELGSDDLFVALQGDRFDGHNFIEEAVRKGAAGAVVKRKYAVKVPTEFGIIEVEDTRTALGQIAARYRKDFSIPVIAVAGSNGKTTTKELLASVLRQKFSTLSSRASFNNDIGVPVTLLELAPHHQVAVLEFGTNHPGELAALLRLAQPKIGVIPSIGREHLEFFGDLEGVIEEEGALADVLPLDGHLMINGDTAGVMQIVARANAPVVRVGLTAGQEWQARDVRPEEHGVRFIVESSRPSFCREFWIPLLGRHQVINALLCIAVGAEFGMTPDEVQKGLSECKGAKMRLQMKVLNGVNVLDDCYNANADSMRAALETLRELPSQGRKVAVLGDMGELGGHSSSAHSEIGQVAANSGLSHLFTIGRMARTIASAARDAGMRDILEFEDVESAGPVVGRYVKPGDVVLLKASRAAALERIELFLQEEPEKLRRSDASQRVHPTVCT